MDIDGRLAALSFAGTFVGGFALAVACLAGETLAAGCALGMLAFCATELARTLDVASPL